MKTIWIINHYAIPPSLGGLNRHYYFSKFLAEKGYNVRIFSSSKIHNSNQNFICDNSLYREEEIEGVKYTFIRTRDYSSGYLSRILNMFDFPLNVYKASKKFEKPDVIYSSSPSPLASLVSNFLSKKYSCESIVEVRDLWPESFVSYNIISKKNPILKLLYLGEKFIYGRADKLLFTMEGGKDYIRERKLDNLNNGLIDVNRIYHINNGVDLSAFNHNKNKYYVEDVDLENPDTFKVIYTGSIRLVNKMSKILDVAKELSNTNIVFLIWGEGDQVENLKMRVQLEGISNVIFKGRVEKKYIPYIISKSDLNIAMGEENSLYKYGLSMNKLFDYFASGKPTLFTFRSSYSLIKKYQAGKECSGNIQDIAQEILNVKNMPAHEYKKMCENAIIASKDYDYRNLTEKLVDVINA